MKVAWILGIIVLFVAAIGCGPTEGPRRKEPQLVVRAETPEAVYIDIDGVLETPAGEPVQLVNVSAETPYSVDQDVTNRLGKFTVHSLFGQDETINFRFASKDSGIEWTYSLHTVPKGVERITLRFVLRPNGSIDHVGTEY